MTEDLKESTKERGRRRVLEGVVVSAKMEKTITVRVDRVVHHPIYKKAIVRSKKYLVHDEHGEARVGDRVRIVETRPLSRRKHFRLLEIVDRSKGGELRVVDKHHAEEAPEPAAE